jgi:hypothetical protein
MPPHPQHFLTYFPSGVRLKIETPESQAQIISVLIPKGWIPSGHLFP